jgi:transcription antitermination factor NusG
MTLWSPNIRGVNPIPFRSSRGDEPDGSMRAEGRTEAPAIGQPVVDWAAEFASAIALTPLDPQGSAVVRHPAWYVLRFETGKERLLRRLLGLTHIPYHHLLYRHQISRQQATERAWFPGHMFLEFDIERDAWQQVLRMPAVIELLGGIQPKALPDGTMEDLVGRLPYKVPKGPAFACVAPGQRVRIIKGPFLDHEGAVTWSDRRRLKVTAIMFNMVTEVELELTDVVVIG